MGEFRQDGRELVLINVHKNEILLPLFLCSDVLLFYYFVMVGENAYHKHKPVS